MTGTVSALQEGLVKTCPFWDLCKDLYSLQGSSFDYMTGKVSALQEGLEKNGGNDFSFWVYNGEGTCPSGRFREDLPFLRALQMSALLTGFILWVI